jgi:hypothetical protein
VTIFSGNHRMQQIGRDMVDPIFWTEKDPFLR